MGRKCAQGCWKAAVESEVEFVIQSRNYVDGVDLRLGFRQSTVPQNVSGTNARTACAVLKHVQSICLSLVLLNCVVVLPP